MLDRKISEKKNQTGQKMKFLSANMRMHGLCMCTQGPCMRSYELMNTRMRMKNGCVCMKASYACMHDA